MNCKAGDLAIIVPPAMDSVGRIVRVLRAADPMRGHFCWICDADGAAPIRGVRRDTDEPLSGRTIRAPDIALRPINGVDVTDDVTEDLKEPA